MLYATLYMVQMSTAIIMRSLSCTLSSHFCTMYACVAACVTLVLHMHSDCTIHGVALHCVCKRAVILVLVIIGS